MAEAITESSVGPQVAYELGKNPAEAARIASLPPMRQIAEIGQLEARLGTGQGGRTTAAPSASRSSHGAAGVSAGYDPNTGSTEDYRAWRATQKPSR
jgi:hypothetical protein